MLTDTHCHILSTEYYNPQSIIDNLSSSNIKRIIINGYNQISNEEVLKLINNQNVYGALGIHPDNINLNLDKEFYSDHEDITNPEEITVLVNKFHKLSSDYEPSDLT